jgi:ankyrin repeat protein
MPSSFINAVKTFNTQQVHSHLNDDQDINMLYEGESALHYLLSSYDNTKARDVFKILLTASKINLNIQDSRGTTPLHKAVERGLTSVVKLLLTKSADPHISDFNRETPLHRAVVWYSSLQRYISLVTLLINAGAPLHTKNLLGFTPYQAILSRVSYHISSEECIKPFTKPLLLAGIVDTRIPYSKFCDLPLQAVLESNSNLLIYYCITNRTIINKQDDECGATLLMYAAARGYQHMVTILLAHGADSSLRDRWGRNLFDIIHTILATQQIRAEQKNIYIAIMRTCRYFIYKTLVLIKLSTHRLYQRQQLSSPLPKDLLLPLAMLMISRHALPSQSSFIKKSSPLAPAPLSIN